MSYLCNQVCHEVTIKAIYVALKLCIYVFAIYESLKSKCSGFPNCLGAAQHCLPHLTHLIQLMLISRDLKTCSGSEKV